MGDDPPITAAPYATLPSIAGAQGPVDRIINDQAFLDELAGEGLIVDDGEVVQLAA